MRPRGTRHPEVQDGSDVAGIGEPARGTRREQDVEVVVVGLGAAQFGGQSPERVGLDRGVGLLLGETRVADKGDPAFVLGCGGDGLVLGGEMGDRTPLLLFGGGDDGLVCGQLRPDVLEHTEQRRPARRMMRPTNQGLGPCVGDRSPTTLRPNSGPRSEVEPRHDPPPARSASSASICATAPPFAPGPIAGSRSAIRASTRAEMDL